MRGVINNKLNKLKKTSFLDLEISRGKKIPGVGAYKTMESWEKSA